MNQGVLFQVQHEGRKLDVYGITNHNGINFFVVYDVEADCFDVLDITECSRI